MPDVEAAAAWLSSVEGNILVTTGSKELAIYTRIRDYEQRVYARILPSAEAVAQCRSLGFEGRHIIAMQGPFSEENESGTAQGIRMCLSGDQGWRRSRRLFRKDKGSPQGRGSGSGD